MKRITCEQRENWQTIIEGQGLTYWPTTLPDESVRSYWREGAYYEFTREQIEQMYADAATLFEMFVEAGDYLLDHPDVMFKMGIPKWCHEQIRASWNRRDEHGNEVDWGSIYGRIDAQFDPATGRIRLYEFNADTPTGLPESAVVQWYWHEETGIGNDQWNSIYDMLVEAWRRNIPHIERTFGYRPKVYLMPTWEDNLLPELAELHPDYPLVTPATDSHEDVENVLLHKRACEDAGFETEFRYIQEVFLGDDGRLYDNRKGVEQQHLDVVFKLYPWEFMTNEEFGRATFRDMARVGNRLEDGTVYVDGTLWIEPAYKMLWSNKGILPVLWQLYRDDPDLSQLLIPSYFDGEQPAELTHYIRKPLLGREGASMKVIKDGEVVQETDGIYGSEGHVVQDYCPPPTFDAPDGTMHPTLGIWYVDGEPAGLGIRESDTAIADNLSYFIPHVIQD